MSISSYTAEWLLVSAEASAADSCDGHSSTGELVSPDLLYDNAHTSPAQARNVWQTPRKAGISKRHPEGTAPRIQRHLSSRSLPPNSTCLKRCSRTGTSALGTTKSTLRLHSKPLERWLLSQLKRARRTLRQQLQQRMQLASELDVSKLYTVQLEEVMEAQKGDLHRRMCELRLSRGLLGMYQNAVAGILGLLQEVQQAEGAALLLELQEAGQQLQQVHSQVAGSLQVMAHCDTAAELSRGFTGADVCTASLVESKTTTITFNAIASQRPASVDRPPSAPPQVDGACVSLSRQVEQRITLSWSTANPKSSHHVLQAAWMSFHSELAAAFDDNTADGGLLPVHMLQRDLLGVPKALAQAMRHYWLAAAMVPAEALRASIAVTSHVLAVPHGDHVKQMQRTVAERNKLSRFGAAIFGVVVAYVHFHLTVAGAGLEVMNSVTALWFNVINRLFAICTAGFSWALEPQLLFGRAPQDSPRGTAAAHLGQWLPHCRGYVPLALAQLLLALLQLLFCGVSLGLGVWHLLVCAACAVLTTCNIAISAWAATVHGAGLLLQYCPPGMDAAAQLQAFVRAAARSMATCSLTAHYGCHYVITAMTLLGSALQLLLSSIGDCCLVLMTVTAEDGVDSARATCGHGNRACVQVLGDELGDGVQ